MFCRRADLQRKGRRKKVVAVHDTVAEVMKGKGGRGAGERASAKDNVLLENAKVSRRGLAENQSCGPHADLHDGGHVTDEK